jgi:hypothetical protein
VIRRFITASTLAVGLTASMLASPADAAARRVVEGAGCDVIGDVGVTRAGLWLYCDLDLRPDTPTLRMWQRSNLPYTNGAANASASTVTPGIGQSPTNFWPIAFFTQDLDRQRWGVSSIYAFAAPTAFSGYFNALAFEPGATNFFVGFRGWVNVFEFNAGVISDQASAINFLGTLFPGSEEFPQRPGLLGDTPAIVFSDAGVHELFLVIDNQLVNVYGTNTERTLSTVNQILSHNGRAPITDLVPVQV